jgi:hypothetical protein
MIKKKSSSRKDKNPHPAEVRNDIARMVKAEATTMAQAVIDEGKKGQLATVKYLFEVASIHPLAADGEQVSTEEESLAKTLLRRLNLPEEPIMRDEDEETAAVASAAGNVEAEDDEPGGDDSAEAPVEPADGNKPPALLP